MRTSFNPVKRFIRKSPASPAALLTTQPVSTLLFLIILPAVVLLNHSALQATKIAPTPLARLVAQSSVVVGGTVVKVDMVSGDGQAITELEARTGPGLNNTIRYHLRVETVFKNKTKATLPAVITAPLWQKWHMSLDSAMANINKKMILLLNADLSGVSAAEYIRDASEEKSIRELSN